jgi:hypothetical protein
VVVLVVFLDLFSRLVVFLDLFSHLVELAYYPILFLLFQLLPFGHL